MFGATDCAEPALTIGGVHTGGGVNVIVTLLLALPHAFVTVHLNTFAPGDSPDTVLFLTDASAKDPDPETTVQAPVSPTFGAVAFKVAKLTVTF